MLDFADNRLFEAPTVYRFKRDILEPFYLVAAISLFSFDGRMQQIVNEWNDQTATFMHDPVNNAHALAPVDHVADQVGDSVESFVWKFMPH
jgi:hypothetical protein